MPIVQASALHVQDPCITQRDNPEPPLGLFATCGPEWLAEADSTLDLVYHTALAGLGPDLHELFRSAQSAWIAFRDAQMQLQAAMYNGWPDDTERLGLLFLSEINLTRERTQFLRVVCGSLCPTPEAYKNSGLAYANQGQYELAIADFNRALELNPRDAEAFNNRGGVYANQGQWDLAFADFNRALELNPSYAEALNNRGGVYANQGRYDLAFADFNRALELNPSYGMAYNNRGWAMLMLGDSTTVCSEAKRACELGVCDLSELTKSEGVCP
jgi:tetratricopeptide (TPR) repeat protein